MSGAEWFEDDSFWIDQYPVMFSDQRFTAVIVIQEGQERRTFNFDVTVYSGQELRDPLEAAGFSDVTLYGNLSGGEYGFNAERLIAVARKP